MEQWEIDRRKYYQETIPDGCYQIGTDDFFAYTGKGGYIEYQIALEKAVLKFKPDEEDKSKV